MHGKAIVVSRAALQHGFKSQYYKDTRRDDRAKGVNISKSLQKRLAVELQDQAKVSQDTFSWFDEADKFQAVLAIKGKYIQLNIFSFNHTDSFIEVISRITVIFSIKFI